MCHIVGQRKNENEKRIGDVPEFLLFIKNLSAEDEEPPGFDFFNKKSNNPYKQFLCNVSIS